MKEVTLTVTLNPAIDQTLEIPGFAANRVNRVAATRLDAGGKGINVASMLGDLGMPTVVTGFLGEDNAAIFERHFAAKSLRDRFLRIPGSTRTGIKVIDPQGHGTTDINFPGLSVDASRAAQLLATVEALCGPGIWCVLSGSLPPGLPPDYFAQLIGRVHARGGRAVLDTSGEPFRHALRAKPDIVKPNLHELEELLGSKLRDQFEVRNAVERLRSHTGMLAVVSMGAAGAVFADATSMVRARPPQVDVRSTVGAGDAMVAGILWAQMRGLDLAGTARVATAFGAYAVTRCGAGAQVEEIRALEDRVTVEAMAYEPGAEPVIAMEGA